jgi:predicted regulator of Ras-like GTPase activity (Roadblock/LC7/MglB family)
MFGFLKSILGKSAESPAQNLALPSSAPATAAPAAHRGQPASAASLPAGRSAVAQGKGIEVPLKAILRDLPLELQPRIRQAEVGELAVAVSLEKVLSQLSRGVVKMTFGELRMAAPHVFAPQPDRDRVLVPLPLAEVLSRLNPNLIARRRVQRQIEIPAEISSPFDAQRRALVPGAVAPRTESAPQRDPAPPPPPETAPAPIPMPAFRRVSSEPAETPIPARHTLTSTPAPAPPAAAPLPAPTLTPYARPSSPLEMPNLETQMAPPPPPAPAVDPNPFVVPLVPLAEAWPETVRREIVQLGLTDARVALPSDMVERGLKQGRICFSWKTLRSWLRPSPQSGVSASDNVVLELPLKVIAPLFLTRKQENARAQQRIAVDAAIPNLFFGGADSHAAPAAQVPPGMSAPRMPEPRPIAWDDQAASTPFMAAPQTRPPASAAPRTAGVRPSTPNEIVAQAVALEGVAGALIALPDGLLVAGKFEAEVNAETLAAFLPQIFGKVSQSTKELRMGELNHLSFQVGATPWAIFRVNAIFFAAYGRAGQTLPTAKLAALAVELNHKPR